MARGDSDEEFEDVDAKAEEETEAQRIAQSLANPQVVTYYKAAAEIANSAPPAALAAATLHLGSVSGATHPGCQRRSPPSLRTSRRA